MKNLKFIFVLIFMGILLSGCSKTVYRSTGHSLNNGPFEREVRFQLSRLFYSDFPECVVIFPTVGKEHRGLHKSLEDALTRHLVLKVPKVLSSEERRSLEKKMAVSIGSEDGRQLFAQNSGCRHAARINLMDAEDSFLGVWSQKKITIEARLFRISDERDLWLSRHAVSRSDGSLPVSPLSVGVGLYKASAHSSDPDILMSMIDDALRRMMVTIPTIR